MITKNDTTVTEKDKMEQPDHEDLFHIIASSAQDAILMLNEVGNITFWNEAAERIFGYTCEEIIGQNMHAILPPMPFREAHKRAFPHFQQTGHGAAIGKTIELAGLRKDGSEFPLELSLSAVKVDITWHSIGIVRDITKHKAVLKTLQNALEFQKVLMDAIPSPIFFKDLECKYTGGNKAFEQYIGLSKEQFIGKSVFDIAPSDLAEGYFKADREMFNNPGISSYETSVTHADGTLHDVIFHKSTFLDPEGNLAGLIGFIVDVTEKTALEKQLKKNIDELTAANLGALMANRCKSDFIANMSHELRTPLNSVIGFSEVLLDQLYGPINEQQKEYAENILYSGKHLLSMINDILDLAKVESGKMELELDTFSLQETVAAALMMFKEKALKAEIELNFEHAMLTDVQIRADQRKLKQIMINLLSNAIKFTQEGGTVTVTTRFLTQPSALNSQLDRDFIEISVEDTGIGIKAEDISKLFKEFTQLESAYTKIHEGTGIGLVLSRQFVELHGGTIRLESEFGTGSRFSFTIPLLQEGTADAPAKKPDIASSSDDTIMRLNSEFNKHPEEKTVMPQKILIVEDNANNRSLFRDILIFHDYEVSEAVDGQDGVDQARKLMPDLILMDIQMPGMDGITAGSILKGDPATAGLKIIALTSFAMQGDREKFMEAGFDGYLSKPINTRELPEQVKHWLDGEGPS